MPLFLLSGKVLEFHPILVIADFSSFCILPGLVSAGLVSLLSASCYMYCLSPARQHNPKGPRPLGKRLPTAKKIQYQTCILPLSYADEKGFA